MADRTPLNTLNFMSIPIARKWHQRVWRGSLRSLASGALAMLCCGAAHAQTVVQGVDPQLSALLAQCAPTVHPETMAAVISAESRGHQFAIADAGPLSLPWSQRKALVRSLYPGSVQEAVSIAQDLIAKGHTVSLGVSQVNDRNLKGMGVTIQDMFDPCTNVAVGGKILTDFYDRAVKKFGEGAVALQAALSAYNSGDWSRGARDGYVNLVYKQLGRPLTIRTERVVPRLTAATGITRVVAAPKAPANAVVEQGGRAFTLKASNFSVTELN